VDAVARWRRSGLTAREFAEREGLSGKTLAWWSCTLGRGTRAKRGVDQRVKRGSVERVVPLEIDLDALAPQHVAMLSIEAAGVVVRVPVGTDVTYVATLARSLAAAR
jgi:hypothetical protein